MVAVPLFLCNRLRVPTGRNVIGLPFPPGIRRPEKRPLSLHLTQVVRTEYVVVESCLLQPAFA